MTIAMISITPFFTFLVLLPPSENDTLSVR